ncbi:Uncharacterised protein [Mycobacteroides abscessus subsp. abscessus]|nr:Uncharacterised protein [Mycobacteroides abscessus subsp. abscessus]
MFAKSQHTDGHSVTGDYFQRFAESLTIRRGHKHPGQALGGPQLDMSKHVDVDVAVLVDLGFGEYRKPNIAQRLDPRAHHFGTPRRDIGKDGGLGFDEAVGMLRRISGGALEQPTAQRVEAWPVLRGGPAAEDGSQSHVEVWCVPHQQHP